MKRPLVLAALALASGVLLATLFPSARLPGIFILSLAGICCAVWHRFHPFLRALSVVLCLIAAGGAREWAQSQYLAQNRLPSMNTASGREFAEFEGVVREVSLNIEPNQPCWFILDTNHARIGSHEEEVNGGLRVQWNKPAFWVRAGEHLRIRGRYSPSIGHTNPGVSGVEDYYRRQGVEGVLRAWGASSVERMSEDSWWPPRHGASRLRAAIAAKLAHIVPPNILPFICAIWLGERGSVGGEEYQHYINTGTAHILAVSGIHVGIVFMSVEWLLRILITHRKARAYVVMAFLCAFALLSGARVSALRAVFMVCLYLAADLIGRERDTPNALAVAAIALLLMNPLSLFGTDFQLSFLSVASILLFAERSLGRMAVLPGILRKPLATSLAVQVLPFPIAVHAFHVIPLLAPLANLVIVPLLGAALWLSLLATLTVLVCEPAASLFGQALEPVVALIRYTAAAVSSTPGNHFGISSPSWLALIPFYGAVFLGLAPPFRIPWPRVRWVAAGGLAGAYLLAWITAAPPAGLVFLDVGHGDATFIHTPGGATALVDGGDCSEYVDAGSRDIVPFLRANGVDRLDYVFVSHGDRDHIGGLFSVMEQIPVGTVFIGYAESQPKLVQQLIEQCAEQHTPVKLLSRGDTIPLSGAYMEVLHPPLGWPLMDSINDASLVLRLVWPDASAPGGCFRVLLTGDIEARAESALRSFDIRANVIKVPHHGSRTSSTMGFIQAVAPQCAIISSGGTSGREPADPAIAARYAQQGAKVFRTDLDGGISLTFKEGALHFNAARSP